MQNALAEARFGLALVLAESDPRSARATELARLAAETLKKSKSVPELGTYRPNRGVAEPPLDARPQCYLPATGS